MSEDVAIRTPEVDVSVVMPVRNGASTLARALDALRQQQATCRWELIVVDDGSTDSSLALASERVAGHHNARVVGNMRTPGAAGARNTGIAAARGRVVAFCDADDRVDEGWVQAAFEAAKDGGAFSGFCRQLREPFERDTPPISASGVFSNAFGPAFRTCNAAVHTHLLREIGGFDESLGPYGHEDSELCARLTKAGAPIRPALDMLVYYHETSSRRVQFVKVWKLANAEYVYWARHPERFEWLLDERVHRRQVAGFPAYYLQQLARRQPLRLAAVGRDAVTRLGRLNAARHWRRVGGTPPARLLDSVLD